MLRPIIALAAATLAATPALAAWDRNHVWDPAYDRSLDRQTEAEGLRVVPIPPMTGTALGTHGTAVAPLSSKSAFGPHILRWPDGAGSPYDN